MKQHVMLFFLLLGTARISMAQGTVTLNIEQCYDMLAKASPLAQKKALTMAAGKLAEKNYNHKWLPQVDLNAQATYQSEVTSFPAKLPNIPYSATTDKNGLAVIGNVPAVTWGLEVVDPEFHVPLQEPKGWRDRNIGIKLSSGTSNKFELMLEPKGKDFIGSK